MDPVLNTLNALQQTNGIGSNQNTSGTDSMTRLAALLQTQQVRTDLNDSLKAAFDFQAELAATQLMIDKLESMRDEAALRGTVKALPELIDFFQSRGLEFSVNEDALTVNGIDRSLSVISQYADSLLRQFDEQHAHIEGSLAEMEACLKMER